MRKLIRDICTVWWENLFSYLLWMVGAMFIFMYISARIATGADWEEEDMVWDEDKQEFVFTEKKGKDKKKDNKNRDEDGWVIGGKRNDATNQSPSRGGTGTVTTSQPPKDSWESHLPRNVRNGKRNATEWEIKEAHRKHWAKGVRTQRAMAESQQRKQLIAHRKATGWYAARRNAGLQQGAGAYNMHMQMVSNGMNNMRYGNVRHDPSCAPFRANVYANAPYRPAHSPIYNVHRYNPPKYPAYTTPPQNYAKTRPGTPTGPY